MLQLIFMMPGTSIIYLYFQLITSFLPLTLSSPEQIEQKLVNQTNNNNSILLENVTDATTINSTNVDDDDDHDPIFRQFGSLHTLGMLSNTSAKEEELYNILKLRHQHLSTEIGLIRRYIAEYRKSLKSTLAGVKLQPDTWRKLIESSPVLEHRMADGFVKSVDKLRKLVKSNDYINVTKTFKQVLEIQSGYNNESQREWPSTDDLYVSHHAILDIQHIYDVGSGQIFQGLDYDTNFGGHLKTSHCALLGTMALSIGHFVRSVEWLEFTLAYMDNELSDSDNSVPADLVKRLLRNSIQEHNNRHFLRNDSLLEKDLILEEDFYLFDQPVYLGQKWSRRLHLRKPLLRSYGKIYGNDSDEVVNMFSLCMGDDVQPEEIKSRLHCYLDRKRHPYFLLNPLKTELLSEYPYVVQLYDVLGNDTLEEMHKKRGKLHVSQVVGDAGVLQSLETRSSAGSVPEDDFVFRVQNRSELISGLLVDEKADVIQTVEYTYGRHYKVHIDPMTDPGQPVDIVNGSESEKKYGDRVATILYYGDIPSDGGDTAFNQVGITARPVRGSAVFWINMFRNGSIRTDVSHTACPVIHGHKTIINQWVRYNRNFQAFKCALNQFD